MKAAEIGTFSDVLFYMERHGIDPDDAKTIALQLFNWGTQAAIDRLRPSRPTPVDLPEVPEQAIMFAEPAPAKPKASKPAKTRQVERIWPEDFILSPDHIKFAADRGFNTNDTYRMWERFRDRNQARGQKYADWNAAWRTWVNNQVDFKQRDNPRGGHQPDGRL